MQYLTLEPLEVFAWCHQGEPQTYHLSLNDAGLRTLALATGELSRSQTLKIPLQRFHRGRGTFSSPPEQVLQFRSLKLLLAAQLNDVFEPEIDIDRAALTLHFSTTGVGYLTESLTSVEKLRYEWAFGNEQSEERIYIWPTLLLP